MRAEIVDFEQYRKRRRARAELAPEALSKLRKLTDAELGVIYCAPSSAQRARRSNRSALGMLRYYAGGITEVVDTPAGRWKISWQRVYPTRPTR